MNAIAAGEGDVEARRVDPAGADPEEVDLAYYRACSADLRGRGVSDGDTLAHFRNVGRAEQRPYRPTRTAAEAVSMAWLRGRGYEVGAGRDPAPLFGDAHAIQIDCDPALAFGGRALDVLVSVDDPDFAARLGSGFDFAVAFHVLEHCDSFVRGLRNLLKTVRRGGVVYVALPDVGMLADKTWMPHYDWRHHLREYTDPLRYAARHDREFISGLGDLSGANPFAEHPPEFIEGARRGRLPQAVRFFTHKHNYDFDGWTRLIHLAIDFLHGARLVDARYGFERHDCHFVLRRE